MFVELGQVWVQLGFDSLWIVTEVHDVFPYRVFLKSYGGDYTQSLIERDLRMLMLVWEDHRAFLHELHEKEPSRELLTFLNLD